MVENDRIESNGIVDNPTGCNTMQTGMTAPMDGGKGVPGKSGHVEFVVGVTLLGVLGGAFVLTAFVLLGIHYMDGFLRGMCLYGVAAILLLVSESVIWRKLPGLSCVLTSLGLGGLYVSTIVNSVGLGNFPSIAGLVLVSLITVFSLLLCRIRGLETYRLVGLLFCFGCFGLWTFQTGVVGFLGLGGLFLGVNLAGILLPVRRKAMAMTVFQMLGFVLTSRLFLWHGGDWNGIGMVPQMVYIMGVVLILHLLVYRQLRTGPGISGKPHNSVEVPVLVAAYLFSLLRLRGMILYNSGSHSAFVRMGRYQEESVAAIVLVLAGLAAVCVLCFFLLRGMWEKWLLYYFGNLVLLEIVTALGRNHEAVWCVLLLLVAAKLLSLSRSQYLRGSEAVITGVATLTVFVVPEHVASWLILGVLLGGLALVRYWHAYYEVLATYTLAMFAVFRLTSFVGLKLVVFTGILFLGLFLVGHVKKLQGRYPLVYLVCNLTGLAGCYLTLMLPAYRGLFIVWFCMLVFGICIITVGLGEQPWFPFDRKLPAAELFAAYMVLVLGITPVIGSVLVMVIALAGVAAGFAFGQKGTRICGLILSVLVCGKIVLYDLRGGEPLQRILLFLSVGILALVIAGIYIVLEKKFPGGKKGEDQSCENSEVDGI